MKELPTRVIIWTNYKFTDEPGNCVWIKSSPKGPRVTCKWSPTTEHSTKVDGAKRAQGQQEQVKNNNTKRHSSCFPKFTPKGATSPLRKDSRVDAQESLCSSPKREITSQARGHLLWDVVVQTSRGHTREDAPRATPNRLEASFKSNKRESMDENASSAHEMKMAAHTSQRLKLTLESCSHPSPNSNQLKD